MARRPLPIPDSAVSFTTKDGQATTHGRRYLDSLGEAIKGLDAAVTASDDSLAAFIAGASQGSVLYKGASDWEWLGPGTSGQVLRTNGAGANPSWVDVTGYTLGTPSTATGGTRIDFTSIPSTVRKVRLSFVGMSTNGTSRLMVQIGTGGSPTSSGYTGYCARLAAGGNVYQNSGTGQLITEQTNAASAYTGFVEFVLVNSSTNRWLINGTLTAIGAANDTNTAVGSVALSGALDMVRLTTEGGVNTFDLNTAVNILYI